MAAGEQVVQVSLEGFFSSYEPLTIVDEQLTDTDTLVLLAEEVFVMDSSGGEVFPPGGAGQITLSSNSLVDANGDSYSGVVNVGATVLDPLNQNFFESFPGDFIGVSSEGELVDIISFGVMAVELTDDQGNPLEIADGQTAELRIAVADPANAPPSLPLWFLDESTGQWTEEGAATLVGNEYVGTVTHFSWWNFDYRPAGFNDGFFARTNISGRVVDELGVAVASAEVRLNSIAGLAWADTLTTNANGEFSTTTFVARGIQAPSYTAYARKDGLVSVPTPIALVQNQDVSNIEIVLLSPAIRLETRSTIDGEVRTLVNNGPSVRFGNATKLTTFRLSNNTVDGLEIASIALQDDSAAAFAISLLGAPMGDLSDPNRRGNLSNGQSILIGVLYTAPASPLQTTANLVITSNDAEQPILTIPLEAGTDRTVGISQSVVFPLMLDHTGFIIRDQGGLVTPVTTSNDAFAPITENGIEAIRVMVGFDISSIASASQVFSVSLTSSSTNHNGLEVLQGGQGPILAVADIEPVTQTPLSDTLVLVGVQDTFLNGAAQQLILDEVASPTDGVFKIMLRSNDTSFGNVDLTQFQLSVNFQE